MAYHPINLALRFILEMAALVAFSMFGWSFDGNGLLRLGLAVLFPVLAAAFWGIFAVPGDPSRSGSAPVPIRGPARLALELLFFGAAAWILAGRSAAWGATFAAATLLHYAVSGERIAWLFGAREPEVALQPPAQPLAPEALIQHVAAAVSPEQPHWVLFRQGTFVVLTKEAEQLDPIASAIRRLEEFGPVHGGGPAGDFSVIELSDIEGWVVSGHGKGIFTYMHPSQLQDPAPADVLVGLIGRSNRDRDARELEVIHVNTPEAA